MKRLLAALCAVGIMPSVGRTQVLLGPNFQINEYTTAGQSAPSVATDGAGNFVVVWTSLGPDGSSFGVVGRRFDASGTAAGEFLVNDYTTGYQWKPRVGSDVAGNFVVVWQSQGQDGDGWGVWAQRYDASGARLGAQFRVNDYTTGRQSSPAVAVDADGDFVVVWDGVGNHPYYSIWAQRFNASGTPQGGSFRVNEAGASAAFAALDSEASGRFVVAWQANQDGTGYSIFGRHFDAAGSPLTPQFPVNTYNTGSQQQAAVALSPTGDFMVTWADYGRDGDQWGIFGQLFASSGVMRGADFQVSAYTTNWQQMPAMSMDRDGNFVVVWSGLQEAPYFVAGVRRYDTTGTPLGAEFRVSSSGYGGVNEPAVSPDSTGRFVVAWASYGHDGDAFGVFGQQVLTDQIFADGFE